MTNTSPAMSNDPQDWIKHHNVSQDRPVVLRTFENIIHVGLTHTNDRLDTKGVRNVITARAREWARENGFTSVTCVSGGWTLGPETSETRLIFICKGA